MGCLVPAVAQTPVTQRHRLTGSDKEDVVETAFDKPLEQLAGIRFADMTGAQKCVFIAKLVACIATFGFAFPNVQND